MKKLSGLFATVAIMAVGLLMLSSGTARATAITFSYDFEFSGATPPQGYTPWITATFDDSFGDENTVRLTMSAGNLVKEEFVDRWLFNFDPNLDPTLLAFSFVSGTAGEADAVSTGVNDYKAYGDSYFDIQFDYPPPTGSFTSKFTEGNTAVYDITYVAPITASSFNFTSYTGGDQRTFKTAAHVQGIDPSAPECAWIAPSIPDPAAVFFLGSACVIAGLAGFRRKLNK